MEASTGMPKPISEHIPKRDYILLPLIAAVTVLVLLIGGETFARLAWEQDDDREPCEYTTDTGFRYTPFCTSRTKVWEGPWITQHYNECGYRSAESCAPRPPGALRVVVVGSSTARGALVNYQDSFAARGSAALTRACGELVDFQNLGTEPSDMSRVDLRIEEGLSLRPGAIVMTVGPFDLIHLNDPTETGTAAAAAPARLTLQSLVLRLRESRLFLLMQYYLYRDPAFQVRAFLLNGDPADYVRAPLTPAWQQRLADFGRLLDRIVAHSRPANVPVLVFYVPERAQAALAGSGSIPPNVDPYVVGRELALVAQQHGARLIDTTRSFGTYPDFQSLYYLTDGHPSVGGHAALAQDVVHALLAEPMFAHCHDTRPAMVESRSP